MITDNQTRKLMKYIQEKRSLAVAAIKSGMDEIENGTDLFTAVYLKNSSVPFF